MPAIDPFSSLLQLLNRQRDFLIHDCAELDGHYESLAYEGRLNNEIHRGRRRGWTRCDLNRAKWNVYLEESFEQREVGMPSTCPNLHDIGCNRISTRVETAYRVLGLSNAVRKELNRTASYASAIPALGDEDCKVARHAVETHWRWMEAYVHMSEERPFSCDLNHDWSKAIEALAALTEITKAFTEPGEHAYETDAGNIGTTAAPQVSKEVSANNLRFSKVLNEDNNRHVEIAKALNREAGKPIAKQRSDNAVALELCGGKQGSANSLLAGVKRKEKELGGDPIHPSKRTE